ncbi:MAG: hypothetical protein E2O39_12455 [Planctomycetota bacterium]|nr:MAG: hypothetical protein E2O39_12455 [Planctomycetota bacterium]
MNFGRVFELVQLDLRRNLRRPLYWIWVIILGLFAWGLSSGGLRIQSGDTAVGGTKAFITSEFGLAMTFAVVFGLVYSFFVAVAAGMTVIQDEEDKVTQLLHSTPLTPREYVWGKFLGVLASILVVLCLHVALAMAFNHVGVDADAADYIGPFALGNYLKPVIFFGLPLILFMAGMAFAVGTVTRKPILVFFLPVGLLLLCEFFLWEWSPDWLDPRLNKALMAVDPVGFRWLLETWLKVDRGADFYNTQPIELGLLFPLSRLGFVALGLFFMTWTSRRFANSLRGARKVSKRSLERLDPARDGAGRAVVPSPISALGMRQARPGFVRGLIHVALAEFRELRSQPGLYLFIPLIILFTVGNSSFLLGAFDTSLLLTPGVIAVRSMSWLTTLVCFLLMFYMVESLRREEATGIRSIYYSTPVGTGALLFGKALANSFVALVIMGVTLASSVAVLAFQKTVPITLEPFLLVWGLLLVPTFLLWCAFVSAAYAFTGSRYTTYAIAMGALAYTGWKVALGELSLPYNWVLWGALQWSDMGVFELTRDDLILNRLTALGLALFLTVLTVRVFPRRMFDATRTIVRLRPRALALTGLRLVPFAALPLITGVMLSNRVDDGFQGETAEKRAKDYWRKNVATYTDARIPDTVAVDIDLELEPSERWFQVKGTYELVNREAEPLRQVLLTANPTWEDLAWTMDGEAIEPEDREGLMVFTPPAPLATGDGVVIGFEHSGYVPRGSTKNGGGAWEFILPSGIVLTSFRPSFVPVVGYVEGRGVDEDNRHDSREYPDDFYEGVTASGFGSGAPFSTRVRITAPEEYTMNSVGVLVSEEVADGRKTVVWESDHPVGFFNVVGGRWAVHRGDGTAIFYHAEHAYNIEEMGVALDAARKFYSEWFYEFPWSELKLSEFPALAGYAQGFATNITFSENIGFLTKSDAKANAVFLVTAHESAHQWWGNILEPGKGPGGNILSEGAAHFSTMLLFEEVLGPRDRIAFSKLIEARYAKKRRVDSERPLVKIDGTRGGDETVTYDKGGWVFWMLLQRMGREHTLAGIRSFIAFYKADRDHPVLQDFVAHLRPFAPDAAAFDDFVNQWFFDVVVPEYELVDVERENVGGANGAERWEVTLRVKNKGTSRMPIEVAAVRGDRFPKADEETVDEETPRAMDPATVPDEDAILAAAPADEPKPEANEAEEPKDPYFDSRVTVTLGAGEELEVTITCDFEPERVLVDPDALILQLGRDHAIFRF